MAALFAGPLVSLIADIHLKRAKNFAGNRELLIMQDAILPWLHA